MFDPKTRDAFQQWLHEAGIVTSGRFARDFNDSLGNAAPFFTGGAHLLKPLAEQEVALRRVFRDTGRVFNAVSREDGQLRGLITNGDATFGALASRDDALAETFEIFPTFLRETRSTVRRLEAFARNTDPLVRDLREPAQDLAPTLRDLGDLSPDLETLFKHIAPLVRASKTGVPAASRFLRGAEPVLEATHVFMPELNPILSYLGFARGQLAQFITVGGAALGGNGEGGYMGNGGAEHYLPQIAMIDGRSFQRRPDRPDWERANTYIAPNAYERATPLGVIESFDCKPNGGEQRDPEGSGDEAAAALLRGAAAPLGEREVPAPAPRQGPVRVGPEGPRGHQPGYSVSRFGVRLGGTRTSCSSASEIDQTPATTTSTRTAAASRPRHAMTRTATEWSRNARWRRHRSRARTFATCVRASAPSTAGSTGAPRSSAGWWQWAWRRSCSGC